MDAGLYRGLYGILNESSDNIYGSIDFLYRSRIGENQIHILITLVAGAYSIAVESTCFTTQEPRLLSRLS